MRVSPLVFGKLRRSTLNPPINLVRDETAGIKSTGTVVVTVDKCQNQWRGSPVRCELRVFACYVSARRAESSKSQAAKHRDDGMGRKTKLRPHRLFLST